MNRIESKLNALLILIISGVLLAAFGVQLFLNEKPCPLCFLQRVAMLAVVTGALLNLKFGIYASHYGLILLSSLVGGMIALRQISLHVCPTFPQFGIPVLGLSLYTWSFIIFCCTILLTAILLCLFDHRKTQDETQPSHYFKPLFFLTLFIALANAFTVLSSCGVGLCAE